MSSEIYYDRAFIRVGDRFIPVVNHGSSNCFDFDVHGREVPEKHWSVLNYTFHGRQLFTEEEIRQIAAVYEAANSDNRDGIRKSRNHSFGVTGQYDTTKRRRFAAPPSIFGGNING